MLGKREAKKKRIFLELLKAWDIRNKIVHGGHHPKSIEIPELNEKYTLGEFVQKIEAYSRSSIRLFLEKQKYSWIDLMFKK